MKANELRVGNWVELNQTGETTYTTIQPSSFSANTEIYFKPISLTAKWVESLGFIALYGKGMSGCDVFQRGRYRVLFHRDRKEYNICVEGISPPTYVINDVQIKYVHQLQNLYFALTGEELLY